MIKILLVEDNDLVREMMTERLQDRGFQVILAGDGQQAVEMASTEQPRIILMDMSLPIMNGWDATRLIKAGEHTRSITVIALTAHAIAGEREKSLAAGCDDYETKPVDFVRLLEKIQRYSGQEAE